ncbi:MAG TPA: hypothetical protein VFT56_16640 [Sphingomonas sp.]|nr:hypothetical protein [Sphingomonas sp.]
MASPNSARSGVGWWQRRLAPLDVSTSIIADHPVLLETASAAYADWTAADPAGPPAIEIRLRLAEASAAGVSDGIQVEGSRLMLAGEGIEGTADARTGRGCCSVPPRLLEDAAALAAEVVDPILLFLLARMGRTPLHAAGIVLGETAVLLAGRSGAGKSTLALAAAADGLSVLSDDTIHVQLGPRLRVWGFARAVHVFPDEAPPGDHAIRIQAGKRKATVALPAPARGRHADRAILVVLDRGERLALEPIPAEEAMARLMRLDPGFDLLREQSAAAIGALAAGGAWRLTLTADPGAAIALLRATFG